MKIKNILVKFTTSYLLALCCAAPVRSVAATSVSQDVGGVKVENTQNVHGATLQLNGAGVRYKAGFKVYTAALYLDKRAGSTDEVLQATGYKRLMLTSLREIEANELGRLFTKGLENNVQTSELAKMIPHLTRMGQLFADQKRLAAGDTVLIDWMPGTGTVITSKGVVQGEPFKDQEFFNGLLRIWLGKSPADLRLKDALLGRPPETIGQSY